MEIPCSVSILQNFKYSDAVSKLPEYPEEQNFYSQFEVTCMNLLNSHLMDFFFMSLQLKSFHLKCVAGVFSSGCDVQQDLGDSSLAFYLLTA